ncbi:glycoside hydrolase family 2 TIM barrel-domain containing protein [Turicibacter sp. H121]|uniref:glycoside hydrolase family 2 TIM barrel-domain containing protein n=2 Tax=Turicibacter sp. H121 TaxID=1712675 RepID=UPI000762EA78|nr:glycoside hydrolase family 2 TIM barrel-domain containing protein [Turicibacter sp. H121]AMC08061.1 hypothetical protein AT726_03255 [Turicibacter sp. H121]
MKKVIDITGYDSKNLFLKFYGSNKKTKVYVDNVEVATHIGGFSTFIVDITDYVNGNSALIKVEVTNLDTDTIPINTDFTHWAGIYRDVELVITDDIYISTEDYGSSGIYLDTNVDLKSNTATLAPKIALSHSISSSKNVLVRATLKDTGGRVVTKTELQQTLNGKVENDYVFLPEVIVTNPHLWQGVDDPYLYTVVVDVLDMAGNIIDSETQRIGFRTFEFKDDGFYLNGVKYKLNGVGFHQDRKGYGNAVSKQSKKEDLLMIREMGANAIRTAHYPHEQYVYDLADEMGFIVWNEIPFYLIMADTEEFRETTKQQLIEMIRQGYNHPSIVFWGIQNEVNTNPSYAQFGSQFDVSVETLSKFMRELAALAKSEDSSRLVAQAHISGEDKARESANWTINSDIDITGFNIYAGWYSNLSSGATLIGANSIGNSLMSMYNKYSSILASNGPIILSEYGAGANINQHAEMNENFIWTSTSSKGDFHPEEYQSFVHEAVLNKLNQMDNLGVAFAWAMFDFSSYRNEGGQERLNDKGLVTYDRQTKKDAFYLYKANWNKEDEFVYITSRRFTERTTNTTDVKVYSNANNVTLTVNGKDYGMGTKQQDGVFVWKNVKLSEANTVVATAYDSNNNKLVDEVKWNTNVKPSGWNFEDGHWYYIDEIGAPKTGWLKDGSKWYYLNDSGAMQTGWLKDGSKWYYLNGSGQMQTGWLKVGNKWYYLNDSGAMQTGWLKDGSKWYYLNDSGQMQTGWLKVGNKWYYLNDSGAMQTGWLKDGSKWYYLNDSGAMQTGWLKDGSKWYYLNNSGAIQTGWLKDGSKWYYLKSNGAMSTGWEKVDGTWYYFYSNGHMAEDTIINGWKITSSGAAYKI